PGLRRGLQRRLSRRVEPDRSLAEQRHARRARFPGPPARRIHGRQSVRSLLPDFLQRSESRARGDRSYTRMVGEWRVARTPPGRQRSNRPLSLFLRRRRILRLRPRKVPGAGWLRFTAGALLSRRHRPRLHGLEARLEGALSAEEPGLPRAPGHDRQALHRRADPGGIEEELHPVLLEEYSRLGQTGRALLLHILWSFGECYLR